MGTTYIIRTNGVDHFTTYTSKARAVKAAESFSKAADMRNAGDFIEVVTEARGKVVYSYTNDIDFSRPNVTVVGEYTEPTTMEDIDGTVIPYDAVRSQEIQFASARIADGGCVGLCAVGTGCEHCDTEYGPEALENAAQRNAESTEDEETEDMTEHTVYQTVMVVQSTPYNNGIMHYHAPGCRDIQRELKRWGKKSNEAYPSRFSTVAEILEYECGDIATDYAESGTPEWWSKVFENATGDEWGGVRIMPCLHESGIPAGETNDGSPVVTQGNIFRAGFKRPEKVTPEDNSDDAGFMETDETVETREYGTTHHTVDPQGKEWERFEHVLSEGDVVKVIGTPGLFTVHALIPGLPVVYVDAHDGREPFPVGASKVYAL